MRGANVRLEAILSNWIVKLFNFSAVVVVKIFLGNLNARKSYNSRSCLHMKYIGDNEKNTLRRLF